MVNILSYTHIRVGHEFRITDTNLPGGVIMICGGSRTGHSILLAMLQTRKRFVRIYTIY